MKKRFIASALAVCVAMSFAACGEKETNTAVDFDKMEAISENTMPITTEDITLTFWTKNSSQGYAANYNDYKVVDEIEKRTGIKLDFIHPAGAAAEQLNIMLASGDLPDIMYYYFGELSSTQKAVEDGTYLDIVKYAEKFAPNYKELLKKEDFSLGIAKHGGEKIGYLPSYSNDKRYSAYNGYFLRKDWLDKVGLDVPKTIPEWEEVLTAFRDAKLGENGTTIPFATIISGSMHKEMFASGFGIPCISNFYVHPETGKVTHPALQPEYKEYITTMKEWYAEGLIDPNFLAGDVKQADSLMLNNQLGSIYIDNNNDIPKYLMADKTLELVAAPYPQKADGTSMYPDPREAVGNYGAVVSGNCKYPVEAVRLVDYLYSQEGSDLLNWGIEGETYTVNDDGSKTFTDLILHNKDGKSPTEAFADTYYARAGIFGVVQYGPVESIQSISEDRVREVVEASVKYSLETDDTCVIGALPWTDEEKESIASYNENVSTYLDEMHQKFVLGKEPIENYDKFVEQIKKIGLEELVKIYQAAYDRAK